MASSTGNLYSFRGEREKAITYFQRALRLDPNFLAAWTLLGHEYLELKSWNAAIEAYRRAVGKSVLFWKILSGRRTNLCAIFIDISPKDYRAWFGLGQAYELLGMPSYAIFYVQKAVALK